jgi:hypothetical protein
MPEAYLIDPVERQIVIWGLVFASFCFGELESTDFGVNLVPFTKFRMRDVWKVRTPLQTPICNLHLLTSRILVSHQGH